jgi:hypothetical protein
MDVKGKSRHWHYFQINTEFQPELIKTQFPIAESYKYCGRTLLYLDLLQVYI